MILLLPQANKAVWDSIATMNGNEATLLVPASSSGAVAVGGGGGGGVGFPSGGAAAGMTNVKAGRHLRGHLLDFIGE